MLLSKRNRFYPVILCFLIKKKARMLHEIKSPSNGLSTPLTNCSFQIIWVCVPSSGIPSIMGISFFSSTLVSQKAILEPSLIHKNRPNDKGSRQIAIARNFTGRFLASSLILKPKASNEHHHKKLRFQNAYNCKGQCFFLYLSSLV